jgi:cytochrome c-type biogenesis protein CcmF
MLFDIYNIRAKKETRFLDNRLPVISVGSGLVIFSYLYFAYSFISGNYRILEVFQYSSSSLGLSERLYASWASNAGSWLFFTFVLAFGYLIMRILLGESPNHSRFYQFMNIFLLFMVVVILIQNPFKTLSYSPSEGMGLNPLLKTPWMLIHPPIVFIGYTFSIYALGLTFSTAKSKTRLTRGIAGIAWLFLTIGIAIGGLWAYEVLGWGGYWAWDPVETSSLVPWLTLTAYFHLVSQLTSPKSTSKDFMLMITGVLIIFASAVTRGGLAVSVHAFGRSPIGYVLLTLMGIVMVYYLANKSKKGYSYFEFEAKTDNVYNASLSMSFLSIVMIGVISLWGIIFPIINSGLTGGDVSIDAAFFNKWSYPFVLVFLASLIGCHLFEKLDLRKYTIILVGSIIIGLIGAIFNYPTNNMLANFGLPLSFISILAVLYNLIYGILRKKTLQISRGFLHFGVVLIVIGILMSSTNEVDFGELVVKPDSTLDLGRFELDFGTFTSIEPTGLVAADGVSSEFVPEFTGLMIPTTVNRDGANTKGDVYIMLYSQHGIVSRPTVIRSLGSEVYIVLHQSQMVYHALTHQLQGIPFIPNEFVISVIYIPFMNLIWLGTLLMCIGIIFPITKMSSLA